MITPQITQTPRTQAAIEGVTCIEDAFQKAVESSEKLERELRAERQKLRTARAALESIEEQWWKEHDTNMYHAGNVMFTLAKNAHAATEDET